MSTPDSVRHFLKRPRNAALLLVLAAAVWAFIFWQNLRSAPVQRHLEVGAQLLARGQGTEAAREWKEAVRLDPQNAAAWELLGDYYIALSNWPAALEAFRRVWELRPDTPNLHSRLALVALRAGDFKTAQRHSANALEQNPKDITALKVAAAVAEKHEKPEEQLKYLRRLVALQPKDPNLLMALAGVLVSQYQYGEAFPLLQRVLQLSPQFTTAYTLRGLIYYRDNPTAERLARAEADFKKVLQSERGNIEAHRYLGRIYLRLNRPAMAIRHFEEVGRHRPHASAHLFELSNAYRKAGDVRKAEELLRRFSSLEQLNHQMTALIERTAKNPNDFDSHLQMARLLLKSVESSDATYHLYGYKNLNRSLGSVAYYLNKAAKLRPGDAKLRSVEQQVERAYQRHIQQGLQAVERRDYVRADWHLDRAVLLRPDDERTRQAMLRFVRDSEVKGASMPRSSSNGPAGGSATGNKKISATTLNAVQSP